MNHQQPPLELSAKREKNPGRIRILFLLYWLRLGWYAEKPDLSERRKKFVDQILKKKGRKV